MANEVLKHDSGTTVGAFSVRSKAEIELDDYITASLTLSPGASSTESLQDDGTAELVIVAIREKSPGKIVRSISYSFIKEMKEGEIPSDPTTFPLPPGGKALLMEGLVGVGLATGPYGKVMVKLGDVGPAEKNWNTKTKLREDALEALKKADEAGRASAQEAVKKAEKAEAEALALYEEAQKPVVVEILHGYRKSAKPIGKKNP